jgi:hypothetical protein
MTRDELLADLADGHEDLLQAVAGLSEEAAAQDGVMAGWSAKDLLAHVTAWEAELLKAMAQARAGKRPAYADVTAADETALNEKWRKEFKKKPLAKVLDDLGEVHKQMLRQAGKLDEAELNDPARFAWTGGQTLAAVIADGAPAHKREHAAQIRAWRNRTQAGE